MLRQHWCTVFVAVFCEVIASGAHAQAVSCDTLVNPLYLKVGDTQEPLMKQLGRALRHSVNRPITLVYVTSGSCENIQALYEDTLITTNPKYIPSDDTWAVTDPAPTCTINPSGHAIDIANSALFVSACDPSAPPNGIALFQGPVQGYGFIVPETSTQSAITAEEAYFVFGFGSQGGIAPWTDETFMFIRPNTKSSILTPSANIRVPAPKWHGVRLDSSTNVLDAVRLSVQPERTIGILGVEIYDRHRDELNMLAFRGYDQRLAYFPDSTRSVSDKRNIRDGHYLPWSPTVWLTHVNGSGTPSDADAAYVIDLIRGRTPSTAPDFNALDLVINVGLVPDCAMQVTRSYEGGDLSRYAPPEPCGCYFDDRVADTTCASCDDQHLCANGTCRYGYCEER